MPEEQILQKLEDHDKRFDEHDKRFDEHDRQFEKIDQRFDAHDRQFEKIDKRFDEHDKKFEKITIELVKHGEKLEYLEENMVTKDVFGESVDREERMLTILKRLDEDRVFTAEWIRKIEKEVEDQKTKIQEHEVLLNKVKADLNIA